ncbi:hypothetical protein CAG99_07575 [Streptomyces marincola]|uniref:Uncharacterized protein n=1 Tax=Streptomyces marincola TaxID=2878388 RepID=A0A1W7CVG8_9ACTN|nr:hypothetical protein CAG99_07575 [Streptomyces marincola]
MSPVGPCTGLPGGPGAPRGRPSCRAADRRRRLRRRPARPFPVRGRVRPPAAPLARALPVRPAAGTGPPSGTGAFPAGPGLPPPAAAARADAAPPAPLPAGRFPPPGRAAPAACR